MWWTREARAALPRESPRYGPAYRQGLVVDAAVGLSLCQPAVNYPSRCRADATTGGGGPSPGLALRVGAGWRFGPNWQLSGAWVRQGHRPGGGFQAGTSNGGMLALRGILPLANQAKQDMRLDLGFELGVGWSQRMLTRGAEPFRQASSGALLRPALILDGWVLADFAIGLEIAPQFNFHWSYCVDSLCEPRPGDWLPVAADRRYVDGLTIAVRISGLLFPKL